MAKWRVDKRLQKFQSILEAQGNPWAGSQVEFVEFLIMAIPTIPDQETRCAMERFYLQGEGQRKGDDRRPAREDGRFYQKTSEGRTAISMLLAHIPVNTQVVDYIRRIYGRSV